MATATPSTPAPEDTAVTQLVRARVGLLVPLIRPLAYEKRFWTSELYQAAAEGHDSLHLFMRLASECLHLFRVQAGVPTDIARPFHILTCKATALVVVHIALKIGAPDLYWDARWVTVAHFRLFFLLITIAVIMSLRSTMLKVGMLDHRYAVVAQALFMYQAVKGSPTLIAARALLLVSCCHISFQHGLMPLLPFVLDIPVHVAYLVTIVRYLSAPAADVITRPNYAPATRKICSVLAALPTTQAFPAPTPPTSSPAAGPCGVQHVWLIILFFQLFVGFCVPVYISYTLERRLKLRFLRHELRRELHELQQDRAAAAICDPSTAAGTAAATRTSPAELPTTAIAATAGATAAAASKPSSWMTTLIRALLTNARAAQLIATAIIDWVHCGRIAQSPGRAGVWLALRWLLVCSFHSCMLGLLAVLSWQLVVGGHVRLARHVKLLYYPGAHYDWFWEVLCGSDGPCCPT